MPNDPVTSADSMYAHRLIRFITNPRPRWWSSASTWIGLSLLGLLGVFLVGGYINVAHGAKVPAQLGPDGQTHIALIHGSGASNNPTWIDVLYEYSNVLGVEHAQVTITQRVDPQLIEGWASDPNSIGIRFPAREATRHYALISRSLRANGGVVTHWTPIAFIALPLKWLLLTIIPLSLGVSLLRTRESRRCQYAANRWSAGLCPVCKYPRDDALDDTCPECGRNMPEQAGLAAERMNRSLDDADARRSPRERRRSKTEIIDDTTPLL